MLANFAPDWTRQREILGIFSRYGWGYMTNALQNKEDGSGEEPRLPLPKVFKEILIDLGPTFIKLGQLLSTRPDLLPPEYIKELSELQADVPPAPWEAVQQVLRSELTTPMESVFREFNPVPVAAGSLAMTYRARLMSGDVVAVKVQRPGIERTVESDIRILKGLADWFSSQSSWGKYYDAKALAEEFAASLLGELDFTREGKNTDSLRASLKGSPWFDSNRVVVPSVYWEHTTQRVLVLEWIEGKPILGLPLPEKAPELADLTVRTFFQQIYVDGFFHADPHPGNLFRLQPPDGAPLRLALLDCGMVGTLDPRTQQLLTEQLLAIVQEDPQRFAQLTLDLGQAVDNVNFARLQGEFDRLLRQYYNRSLAEINFGALLYDMLRVLRENGIRLPGNIGLYVKALANLEGVARSLDPDFNMVETVKPLITELFRRRLFGTAPLQEALRSALDLRELLLKFPRRLDLLLQGLTGETLQLRVQLNGWEPVQSSLQEAGRRISTGLLSASLVLSGTLAFTLDTTGHAVWLGSILLVLGGLLGFGLVFGRRA
ncbi:ABC1 kinase family protein [Gloeobacter violaceus]|uniref:Gll1468 protein n=1 Tax=Gloeobacter violaceus (strain ATCC 29082 / PCC 7421) TaxID=251221 RepID=Q7NKK9_GLOVI|nr:AarF/ABC1/UbiB kinase family protein [Gloeobacter violaceus]BAC89409.1 gll1468 [Gloeobacter violaceus PCC 7421]